MSPQKQPPADSNRPQRGALAAAISADQTDRPVIGSGLDVFNAEAFTGPRLALSIDHFCRLHGIGRRTLYDLWADGRGPKFFKVGSRVLISIEAAAAWRRDMEARAVTEARPKARKERA